MSVSVTWTGPRTIPGERYSVMEVSGSGGTYTSSLTISPLAEGEDDGQYTCSVTVSGGSSVLEATNSDSTTIVVMGKDSIPHCATVLGEGDERNFSVSHLHVIVARICLHFQVQSLQPLMKLSPLP